MKSVLSLEEAMEELGGISRSTIYRLINNKDLLARKIGKRTVVPANAIHNYINNLEHYEGGKNVI